MDWIIQSLGISRQDAIIIILFVCILCLGIIINKLWVKRYKGLPDKKVVAKLIKTTKELDRKSDGSGGLEAYETNNNVGVYEYCIDNHRHTISWSFVAAPPETRIICYKKGAKDARVEGAKFRIPKKYVVFWGLIHLILPAVICQVLSKIIFGEFYGV